MSDRNAQALATLTRKLKAITRSGRFVLRRLTDDEAGVIVRMSPYGEPEPGEADWFVWEGQQIFFRQREGGQWVMWN